MKMKKTKSRKIKGGDFGPVSSTTLNPYTTYDLNTYENDPSREIQSSRLVVGGKKRTRKNNSRKNNSRKNKLKKGGTLTPLKYDYYRPYLV